MVRKEFLAFLNLLRYMLSKTVEVVLEYLRQGVFRITVQIFPSPEIILSKGIEISTQRIIRFRVFLSVLCQVEHLAICRNQAIVR